MAPSPEDMAAAMVANLKEKTGKTLPQWLSITTRSKLVRHGEIVKMLKSDHGMTHGYANLVAHHTLAAATPGDVDLVANQYAGAKASLRPIYDALLRAVLEFGADVEIAPKKTYVSLRRSKQFGLIQPSTKTRVDLGLNLVGGESTSRLEESGSFSSMVTHRVRIEDPSEVDRELVAWLKQAYQSG